MNIDIGEQPLKEHHPSLSETGHVDWHGRHYSFQYRVQDINDRSPTLRSELARGNTSVIGVGLENGTIAWSPEVAHHRDLVEQESNVATVRFQSHPRSWSHLPEVFVHALKRQDAVAFAGFMNRSNVAPETPIELNQVDDIGAPNQIIKIWKGKLSDFDPSKIK